MIYLLNSRVKKNQLEMFLEKSNRASMPFIKGTKKMKKAMMLLRINNTIVSLKEVWITLL